MNSFVFHQDTISFGISIKSSHLLFHPEELDKTSNIFIKRKQGPVVQRLTNLLANVPLKFLLWNIVNTLIFFAEKWG